MRQSDLTFRQNVSFGEMLEMAGKVVESLFGDPDARLNHVLGAEYLYLQAAARLFTNYGATDGQDDIEGFMAMVFSVGVERFENWLRRNAGEEKYNAFRRMVERGAELYQDMKPLETFVYEAGTALHRLNESMQSVGDMTPGQAIELLEQFRNQKEETPPQE